MSENNGSSISLPSFRDGIPFDVKALNLGGTKALVKTQKDGDDIDVVYTMIRETLKREFPNVEDTEIDSLEQEDYLKLMNMVSEANTGLNTGNQDDNTEDFTNPANTTA